MRVAQAAKPRLTPEQLKAMKGPSPDDPLEDANGTAATWVAQFNEQLSAPSTNAAERALLPAPGCKAARHARRWLARVFSVILPHCKAHQRKP